MKKSLSLFLLIISIATVWATPFFTENFNYTAGTTLVENGWTQISTVTTNPITCVSNSITMEGYVGSGVGHAIMMTNTGQDVYKDMGSVTTTGSVYMSFLLNITSITAATAATDNFIGFLPSTSNSIFTPRLSAILSSSDKFKLVVTKANEAVTGSNTSPIEFDVNHTYVVIMEYRFITGTLNDEIYLWVYDSVIPTSQPSPMISSLDVTKADLANISRIYLRQVTNNPTMYIDAIRVGTNWSDLFPESVPTINATQSLNTFSSYIGESSDSQNYTLSGENMQGPITVKASSPFQVSSDNVTFSDSIVVSAPYSGIVYVRFAPVSSGAYTGNITHTSEGAVPVTIALNGNVTPGQIVIDPNSQSISFQTYVNTTSTAQYVSLVGQHLSDVISASVSGPFEISYSSLGPWVTNLTPYMASDFNGLIYVHYLPTAVGTDSGLITFSSVGVENATVALDGVSVLAATVEVNPVIMSFNTNAGTSQVLSYILNGVSLTENIVITSPAGFGVSTAATGPFGSALTVSSTFSGYIYVQYAPAVAGTSSGNITNIANGITTNVAVSGTAVLPNTPMNITVGQTISQNFDMIGGSATATLPTDWRADRNTSIKAVGAYSAAVTASERNSGNSMSATASNGIYNYGAGDATTATDRAIGFLSSSSGTKSGNLYAKLTNVGSTAISAFDISYNVEKYRTGTNTAGFSINLFYSLDGSTWTATPSSFTTTFSADATTLGYTTAPGVTRAVTGRLSVNIPASGNLYLAWNYSVASGITTTYAQALGIDDITITAANLPVVEAPVLSLTTGLYTSPQSVTISSATSGATIYYTLDGSDPTTGSAAYNTAITVSSTTTIKAIAVKSGYQNSAVNGATYTFPIAVNNIATLRSLTAGTGVVYRLVTEAIITLQTSSRNAKYIQDATGAIMIDDPAPAKITSSYNIGDGITGLTGTIAFYNGMLQFVPMMNPGAATSSGNIIEPEVVAVGNLTTDYQAKLVKLNEVLITSALQTTFVAANNYTLNGIATSPILRTQYADLNYIGTALPTTAQNIVGVVLQYGTVTQFIPRSLSEIVESIPPNPPTIQVLPDTLSFGNVPANYTMYHNLMVYNRGDDELSVYSITPTNSRFTIVLPEGMSYPFTIASMDSLQLTVSFTPLAVQQYTANLVFVSNDPVHGAISKAIKGTGYVISADFSANPVTGDIPLPVQFSSVTQEHVVSWRWDFGDGVTSDLANPIHTYTVEGLYTVSLTVGDSFIMKTVTKQNYIQAIAHSQVSFPDSTGIDFGTIYLGGTGTEQLVIQSTGTDTLFISSAMIGSVNSAFHILAETVPSFILPGSELSITIQFQPEQAKTYSDTLFLYSNAENKPVGKITLRGLGEFVPPQAPQNVSLGVDGFDAIVSWDAVSENVFHNPITVPYYFIYGANKPNADEDHQVFLGYSVGTSFRHLGVGLPGSNVHAPRQYFYTVTAVVWYPTRNNRSDFASMIGKSKREVSRLVSSRDLK